MYGRMTAMPEQTEPLQLAVLLATLSVGCEVIRLRRMASALGLGPELDSALGALAQGNSSAARMSLARLDLWLAAVTGSQASLALQARGSILAMSGALSRHASFFDSGAHA
jgi:hypothetical protein